MRRVHLRADGLHEQASLVDIACRCNPTGFARLRAQVPSICRAEHLRRDRALCQALGYSFLGDNTGNYLPLQLLLRHVVLSGGGLPDQVAKVWLATQGLHFEIGGPYFACSFARFECPLAIIVAVFGRH